MIGGLTALILPSVYFSPGTGVFIYDLVDIKRNNNADNGTLTVTGVGRDHCTKAGVREIFVQADRMDKHASIDFLDLENGWLPEDVIHFYVSTLIIVDFA